MKTDLSAYNQRNPAAFLLHNTVLINNSRCTAQPRKLPIDLLTLEEAWFDFNALLVPDWAHQTARQTYQCKSNIYLHGWTVTSRISKKKKKSRVGQYAFKKYHEIQTDSSTLSLDAEKQAEAGVLLRPPVDLCKRARMCVMGATKSLDQCFWSV